LFCTDLLPNFVWRTAANRDAMSEGTAGVQLKACAVLLLLYGFKARQQEEEKEAGALHIVLFCALSTPAALLALATGFWLSCGRKTSHWTAQSVAELV
jgi:hypothetical protein